MQQSPGFGERLAPQPGQSQKMMQALAGIDSVTEAPQCGQVTTESNASAFTRPR